MFQSLFARLLAVFMVVIIGVVSIGASVAIVTIRNNSIESSLANLLVEAREIAYLASRTGEFASAVEDDSVMAYLRWKADNVFQAYGAYILIVDRDGHIMDNMRDAMKVNPDALQSLSSADLAGTLREVLVGKEVQGRLTNAFKGSIFTVAVPWTQEDTVQGAVFIHTNAQYVEAKYRGILPQLSFGFILSFVLAFFFAALYTGAIVKPLRAITAAAESMSRGNFNKRAQVTGVDEVRQLAGAFNVMAEKLELVEENRREFVANVSHELRSPVTNIHGFVEGMLDGTIPLAEQEQYLGIVRDETNRLKRLIADLLQLSRMDKGAEPLALSDYDINEAIRRILIGHMNDIERKKLEVHLEFQQDPCMVCADRDRMAQVLYNLVDNAIKFADEDGNLTIYTSLVHDKVSVVIENDGIPIAEADKPHIFERFYKADKAHTSGKGTGLGLSICQKIMELHGESIRLLPREKGAAFEVMLKGGEKPVKAANTQSGEALDWDDGV